MGTAPQSKLAARVVAPTRPYKRNGRRREPWTLVQLILMQDWQRVLVRAKLFPYEIKQPVKMILYDIPLKLLPLHLACALDPPEAVVDIFLNLYADGAKIPIKAVNNKASRRLKKLLPKQVRALRNKYKGMISNSSRSVISYTSRHGTLLSGLFRRSRRRQSEPPPTLPEQHTYAVTNHMTQLQEQSLLRETDFGALRKGAPHRQLYGDFSPVDSDGSHVWDFDNYPSTKGQESASLIESFSNSSMTSASHKSTVLQLSPSGGIIPLLVASHETDSTSEISRAAHTLPNALFDIHWDLTPLWNVLATASCPDNSLLPIHVASLYQASPAVIKLLADAHPMGVVNSVLGMLPIHLVSAGWTLQELVPKPSPLHDVSETETKGPDDPASAKFPLHRCRHLRECESVRLKETLKILCRASPQSTRIRSGNHGMTPVEYISEAMEEGPEKQECLSLLQQRKADEEHKTLCEEEPDSPLEQLKEMASTSPSVIFFDTCDGSKEVQSGSRMTFDSAVEVRRSKNTSIHSLLMSKDWEGALSLAEDDPKHAQEWFYGVDDQQDETIHGMMETKKSIVWKRLALHLACVYRAPVGLADVLLQANPKAATSSDPHSGVLPIHLACHYGASYRLIKALLMHAPQTTKAVDNCGRLPLHWAVLAKSHYAIIELLIIADPAAVLVRNRNEKTPLELAVEMYGKDSIMTRLLEMVTLAQQAPR